MKKKGKSISGFTLAELLIVVAIIAILVAIGIPIFIGQLEKSREAVDLSNLRNIYAQLMYSATAHDVESENFNGYYWVKTIDLKQTKDDWQSGKNGVVTIGGYSSNETSERNEKHWIGFPTAKGTCTVFVTEAGKATFCFGYNFAPCLDTPIPDIAHISTYKGLTISELFTKKGFDRVQSSGPTGSYLREFIRSTLHIPEKDFSYCCIPDNKFNPSLYTFYISTDYKMKYSKDGEQPQMGNQMTVIGYQYDPKTNRVIKTGTPQTIYTYVGTQYNEKFEGMIITGKENGVNGQYQGYQW